MDGEDEDLEGMNASVQCLVWVSWSNVDSCTHPQHLSWISPRADTDSVRKSERPKPIIGPVKVTMGGISG